MALLLPCGFEKRSTTAGVEFSQSGLNGGGIITVGALTGDASLEINVSASFSWFGHKFKSADSNSEAFCGTLIKLTTLPNVTCEIMSAFDSVGVSQQANICVTSGGVIQLRQTTPSGTQIGSNGPTLVVGTKYYIEMHVIGGTGTATLEARVNGVVFASSTTATVNTFDSFYLGNPGTSATMRLTYDDWIINDSTGSSFNTWPGEQKVIGNFVTAAGDFTQWTPDSGNNFQRVQEITPDDASSYVQNATLNNEDMYSCRKMNFPTTIFSQSSLLRYATVVTDTGDSGGGSEAWSPTANAIGAPDGVTMDNVNPNDSTVSDSVKFTGFDFSALPSNAIITGFVIYIWKTCTQHTSSNNFIDSNLQILKAGTAGGNNMADQNTRWNANGLGLTAPYVYGSSYNLQGNTLVVSDAQNSNFGFIFRALPSVKNTCTGSIDAVAIQLFYTTISSAINVSAVAVGVRFANDVADATTAFKLQLEKTSGGTILQSSAIIANSTTYKTNAAAAPFNYPLVAYNDPDGNQWTASTIDSMQIGQITSAVGTNKNRVSNIWVMIVFSVARPNNYKNKSTRPAAFKPGIDR